VTSTQIRRIVGHHTAALGSRAAERIGRNLPYRLTGYVGYTQGLAVMEQIYPKGKDGKFGYLEALYRF
jgi:hypothetical protein